jgi:uncharacterized membrane protein
VFRSWRSLLGLIIGLLFGIAWIKYGFWQIAAVLFFAIIGYAIGRALEPRGRRKD